VDSQLLKLSCAGGVRLSRTQLQLRLVQRRIRNRAALARLFDDQTLPLNRLCVAELLDAEVSLDIGQIANTVLPSPMRKDAKTKATTQRPRRNHFSESRRDLFIEVCGANPSPCQGAR
jgi:hypothetical protein